MTRKPLSTPIRPFEGAASYVSRVAALYSAPDARTFSSWFGANFKDVCAGSKQDIEKITDILQLSHGELTARLAIGGRTTRTRRIFDHRVPSSLLCTTLDRVCPACLKDDYENGTGSSALRPYGRMTWMFLPLQTCPRHDVRLERLPAIRWELGDDFLLRLGNARSQKKLRDGQRSEPTPLDRYIVGRFEGFDYRTSRLDELSLSAVLRLCEAFGRDASWDELSPTFRNENAAKINDGFNRIAEKEEDFRKEVQQMITRNYTRRSFTAYSIFADLTFEFVQDLHHDEFSKVADVMRSIAFRMLPLRPGDDLF